MPTANSGIFTGTKMQLLQQPHVFHHTGGKNKVSVVLKGCKALVCLNYFMLVKVKQMRKTLNKMTEFRLYLLHSLCSFQVLRSVDEFLPPFLFPFFFLFVKMLKSALCDLWRNLKRLVSQCMKIPQVQRDVQSVTPRAVDWMRTWAARSHKEIVLSY